VLCTDAHHHPLEPRLQGDGGCTRGPWEGETLWFLRWSGCESSVGASSFVPRCNVVYLMAR
jgi:hypothetical protein